MFDGFMKGIKFITAVITPDFLMFIGLIAIGILILYGFIFTSLQVESTTARSFARLNKFIRKNKLASQENFSNITTNFQKIGGRFLAGLWQDVTAKQFANYMEKFNREIVVSSRIATKTYKVRRAIVTFTTFVLGVFGAVTVFLNAPKDAVLTDVLSQAAALSLTLILAGFFINLLFNAVGRYRFVKLIDEFDTFNQLIIAGVKVAYDIDLTTTTVKYEMAEDTRIYKSQVETLAKKLTELENNHKKQIKKIKAEYEQSVISIQKLSEEQIKQISSNPNEHIDANKNELEIQKLQANASQKDAEIQQLQDQIQAQDISIKSSFQKIKKLQQENEKLADKLGKKTNNIVVTENSVVIPLESTVADAQTAVHEDITPVFVEPSETSPIVTAPTAPKPMAAPKPLSKRASEQEINTALADLLAAMEKYQSKRIRQD